ncbi:MAG TPA: HDOD domain-containing protein, partial [Methylophaga sp.]|nr:HDOD domain-containing protein [Methylophaga sp.]
LKKFSGLIHRQPQFVTDKLNVKSYHLNFLNKQGEPLNDDSPVPDFVSQLPNILPSISEQQEALLSIPESWREALYNSEDNDFSLILDLNDDGHSAEHKKQLLFAQHAAKTNDDHRANTLLIDLKKVDSQALTEHLPYWRQHHKILCATNVDDQADYSFCKTYNLDLLQGQFYTVPLANDNQKVSLSTQTLMTLLVKLQEPDVDAEEIATTINKDLSLSYKLLRLINSAFFGLPREVSSVKQAIVMLGHKKVKTWASLLSLSTIDNKPNELRVVAMTRARMCELLAKYYKASAELSFATGLFSTLDALLDKSLATILTQLPLSTELSTALLNKSGPAGQVLRDVLNYEKGDWRALDASPLPIEIVARSYLDAIHWAKELNTQLID